MLTKPGWIIDQNRAPCASCVMLCCGVVLRPLRRSPLSRESAHGRGTAGAADFDSHHPATNNYTHHTPHTTHHTPHHRTPHTAHRTPHCSHHTDTPPPPPHCPLTADYPPANVTRPQTLRLLARTAKPGCVLSIATDIEDYARCVLRLRRAVRTAPSVGIEDNGWCVLRLRRAVRTAPSVGIEDHAGVGRLNRILVV
jgi:hypothetical protein